MDPIKYFRAGTRIIRSMDNAIGQVRRYFPNAKRISREEAVRHERNGGAIIMVV